MKSAKIRENSAEEVRQLERETRKQLSDLKMQKGFRGTVDNPLRIRTLRRDLARIRTIMKERGI